MMQLRFSSLANLDLIEIADYIGEKNPVAALRVIERIENRCLSLCNQPHSGSRCDDLAVGLRACSVGRYVIYFRSSMTEIEIVRVLHSARDANELF